MCTPACVCGASPRLCSSVTTVFILPSSSSFHQGNRLPALLDASCSHGNQAARGSQRACGETCPSVCSFPPARERGGLAALALGLQHGLSWMGAWNPGAARGAALTSRGTSPPSHVVLCVLKHGPASGTALSDHGAGPPLTSPLTSVPFCLKRDGSQGVCWKLCCWLVPARKWATAVWETRPREPSLSVWGQGSGSSLLPIQGPGL